MNLYDIIKDVIVNCKRISRFFMIIDIILVVKYTFIYEEVLKTREK